MRHRRALGTLMPQLTFSLSRCGPPPGQTLLCSHHYVHPSEPGRAPVQLLEVAVVTIQGQCQAPWTLHWLCRHVDFGQEAARPVGYLDAAGAPVSFRMFPLEATATPVGALNGPLPSPWEPDLKRHTQLALDTFTEWLWKFVTTISFLFVTTKWDPAISDPTASKLANQLVIGWKVKKMH